MCYSAQVIDAYDEYCDVFGADIDIETFASLYGMKLYDSRVKTTRSLDEAFARDPRADMQRVREVVVLARAKEVERCGQDLIEQRERLARAESALAIKMTKKASDEKRIATNKMGRALEKLGDLQRTDLQASDSRMFPGYYVPVMIVENGRKIVRPMRYHLRPAGKPEGFDREFPGTYNARLDKMDTVWRKQFGYTHGIAIVTAFYEHVVAASGEKAILEFKPETGQAMYVACLWSHWTAPGKDDLYSFAFITDEPPPEVLAAGHDRCIIPLKRDDVDAWLNPDPKDLDSLYDILAARERPFYTHKVAG